MKTLIILSAVVLLTQSDKFPENFKKCDRKDPNLNECTLKAAQDGISQLISSFPEINLPSIEPLKITSLNIEGQKGTVTFDQKYRHCNIFGISKSTITKFAFNFDTKTLEGELVVPELKKLCHYEFNGKILVLPIIGEGPSTFILENLKIKFNLKWEESQHEGKTFLTFVSNDLDMEPGHVIYDLENLFNGDQNLGDNINKAINENWREVFEDVKEGYQKGFGLVFQQLINALFNKFSLEEALG